MNINRRQFFGIIAIIGLLLGLLVLPLLAQEIFGISAINVAFAVIVIYALLNYWLKNR